MGKLLGLVGAIGTILGSLNFIIKPIMSLLSVILTLLFLPLLPFMKPAMQALAAFIPVMVKFSKKATEIAQRAFDWIVGWGVKLVEGIIKIGSFIKGIIGGIFGAVVDFGKWIFENIVIPGFEFLLNVGEMIWELLKSGFEFLFNVGELIWTEILKPAWDFLGNVGSKIWTEILKPAWEWFKDIGTKIWGILKIGFDFVKDTLINAIKGIANAIIDMINFLPLGIDIPKLAKGGIVTKPTLAVVGEAGPEAVVPLNKAGGLGGVTLNINNPSIRNDQDIRKLADEVGRMLQRQANRGFS